jgi:hypothetical protein
MSPGRRPPEDGGMASVNVQAKPTAAFYAQAAISFAVSTIGMLIGIAALDIDGGMRAFLALGLLYSVTSSFTLAKCVRDSQEAGSVIHRIDEARLERLLAQHDPFSPAV